MASDAGAESTLAALVRARREQARLTQEQLASRSGLGVRTIRRLENGAIQRPRSESARLLADALGLTDGDRALLVAATRGEPVPVSALGGQPALARPAQLPADLPVFTGRGAELDRLLALAPRDGQMPSQAVVISAIDGMAGIGKTALAVHAGHRLTAEFPDGQLFIDLHGYTQNVAPVQPAEALDRLLRSLGMPGEQIPPQLEDRAALWRSTLAGRRMFILLDNAHAEPQVEPLLPGAAGCLVLITSRARLAGLDGAHPLSLDPLPPSDALDLFTRAVGEHRVAGQSPDLLVELVEACGRLPLALRLAAARLAARPGWTLAHLAQRLRDREHRLSDLAAGQRSVASAIDLSYQHLPAESRRLYRLLGLHPGTDVDGHAAAALAGTNRRCAERLLDTLLDAHLLGEPTAGRYRFHDLVRVHATHTAAREETRPDRRAALTRLFDHYAGTAAAAAKTLYPDDAAKAPEAAHTLTFDGPVAAAAWLDAELANLVTAANHAAVHGWPSHVIGLAAALRPHLHVRSQYVDARNLYHQALNAARAVGDRRGEVDALNALGSVFRLRGGHDQSVDRHRQALDIARTIGHRGGELYALRGLGNVGLLQARFGDATDCFDQALRLARDVGNRRGEFKALTGLAFCHRGQGQHRRAVGYQRQALDLARDIGDRVGQLEALVGLAQVHHGQGSLPVALDNFQRALRLARRLGYRVAELNALIGLAILKCTQRQYQSATTCYLQVLELARAIGSRNGQFEAHHGLGRILSATGHPGQALGHHRLALDLATDLHQSGDQARAHDGLAHAHRALGHHWQARRHWQHALDILTDLNLDEIEEVTTGQIRGHLN